MRIVVTRFQPAGQDAGLAELAAGMTEVVAPGLEIVDEASEGIAWVRPQAPERRPAPSELPEVHRELGANLGIVATLERRGERLLLEMRAVDPVTGRTLREAKLEESAGNPRALQIRPVLRVAEMIAVPVDDTTRERLEFGASNVTAAFDGYVQGVGELALASGDQEVEQEIATLERAVAADPLFAPARLALAHAFLRRLEATGDRAWLERGVRQATAAAALPAEAGRAEIVLGSLHEQGADLQSATAAYRRAVAASPTNPEARVHLARALQKGGHLDEAERELQHAMFLRPAYWPDHHWAALLYMEQGRYDAAVNDFRRVVELAPDDVGGYIGLGAVYAYLDQPDKARQAFERSLEVDSEHNYAALTNLGTLAFSEGRYADAAALYERALAVDDDDYRLWGNLGHAYYQGPTPELAERPLRRAIDLAEEKLRTWPGDSELLSRLAGYHADLGERAAGLAALRAAARMEPDDPVVVAYIACSRISATATRR